MGKTMEPGNHGKPWETPAEMGKTMGTTMTYGGWEIPEVNGGLVRWESFIGFSITPCFIAGW